VPAAVIPLLAFDGPIASDAAKPCRPTVSCTAELAAPGSFEVEAGANVSRNDAGVRTWSYPLLLKQTFAKWAQAQVGSNGPTFANSAPHAGYFDNVFLGPKFHLLDQGKVVPMLCLTGLASFPTAEAPGYARHGNAYFTAHVSKDLGPIHVDWNGAVNVLRIEDNPIAQSLVALALSPTFIPAPFGFAAEVWGVTGAAPVAPKDGGVRLAMTVSPRTWLVFDVGGDIGFFPSTRVFSVFFGVSVVPFVFWRS
jgi:hypothetical protein